MNRDGFWSGKRVLILGCTGFLGTWAVRELLQRGANITGLIRNAHRPSELFEHSLHQHLRTVRGAADPVQLRQLLAPGEYTTVFQLATVWDSPRVKTSITADTLDAIAEVAPSTSLIVPIHANETLPQFQHPSEKPLRVGFVKFPELFGPGQSRVSTWSSRAFVAAAQNRTLPAPTEPAQALSDASTAATSLLENAEELHTCERAPETGHWTECKPTTTVRELFESLSRPAEIADAMIRETINWYEQHPIALGTAAPQSRAA